MIGSLLRVIGILLIFGGLFFFIAATIGLIRMPDPYNRGHTGGKGDSPGFILSLLGVWVYWLTINPLESIKILIIMIFMLFANPIAIHAILRFCYRAGVDPCKGTTFNRAGVKKQRNRVGENICGE